MTFPLFTSILRSPEADPSAGAAPAAASPSAAGGDTPAGASGGNDPAGASPAPAAAPVSLSAARAASKAASSQPAGSAASDNTPEQPMPWLKDGKILDGRYDRDTHKFTPEYVNENPHVRALIEAHHETNRQYSAMKNGHIERLKLKPAELEALDFTPVVGKDGKPTFGDQTRKILSDHMVPDELQSIMAEGAHELSLSRGNQFQSWVKEVDQRHGDGAYEGAIYWAASEQSGLTQEEQDDIDIALNSKTLRDATIDMLHSRYQDAVLSGKYQPGNPNGDGAAPIAENEQLQASNSAGGGQSGEGIFETEEQCYREMPDEQLEPEKYRAWERKMQRSPAVKRAAMEKMNYGRR